MNDAGTGIANALVECVVLGRHAEEFLDLVFRIQFEDLLFAHPWFGVFIQRVKEISESGKVTIMVQFVEGLEGETLEK